MARRDLYRARSQFRVSMFVRHDGHAPPGDGQFHELADHGFVARIIRVHGHGHIGQHRFRPGGGDFDIVLPPNTGAVELHAIGQRIFEMPEMAFHFARFHFKVGNRGFQLRVPVHQAFVAVNQALVVKVHEHFHDRFGKMRVHRELFAAPVHRTAQPAQLARDRAAALLLPLPHLVHEGFARVIGAFVLPLFQLAFHHHLGGDPGMVGSHHPQRILAAQPFVTDDDILQRVIQRMADVQAAGDIGRRVDDGEGGRVRPVGAEQPVRFPVGIPFRLNRGGVESLVQFGAHAGQRLCQWRCCGATFRAQRPISSE